MLFKRLGLRFAAIAAAAAAVLTPSAAAEDDIPGHSTFVNTDGAIGFSIGVPKDAEDEFFFTLRVHRSHAWGAVGLGSEDMPGAMYFFVYDDGRQVNVTFSPRLAYGYYEPAYNPDFEYDLLNGTGIFDDHMIIAGRCTRNCLSWPAKGTNGGKIDLNNENEKAIYALGPLEGFASSKKDESLKFHVQYGSFYMNMTRAKGASYPHYLDEDSRTDGAWLDQKFVKKADVMSTMHAVAMVLAIVLLMPLGAVIMRIGAGVKWHVWNQILAMILVFAGFGVGIALSYRYQRSRKYDSYHQILGFFIVIFVAVQFTLGALHHRQYRRTQAPTLYSKIHLWLGRLILLLGIMNGFFGFTFALNRRYGIILAALVIFMCFASLVVIIGRRFLHNRLRRNSQMRNSQMRNGHMRNGQGSPYNRPPIRTQSGSFAWRESMGPGYDYPAEPPPRYEAPHQNIGLEQVGGSMRRTDSQPLQQDSRRTSRQQPWGNSQAQAPRELI